MSVTSGDEQGRDTTPNRGPEDSAEQSDELTAEDRQELRDSVQRAARELRSYTNPLTIEAYTSTLVNNWRDAEIPGIDPLEADRMIVDVAHFHATEPGLSEPVAHIYAKDAVAVLNAVAAIAEPDVAAAAREKLTDPAFAETERPEWVGRSGTARVLGGYTVDSELGDETEVFLTFAYGDDKPHAVRYKVNHSLAGMVTDVRAEAEAEPALETLREELAEDDRRRLAEATPAAVRALLDEGFAITAQAKEPPVTVGYHNLHVLGIARVRELPTGTDRPAPPVWSDPDQAAIVADFCSAPEASDLDPAAAAAIAREIVGYGVDNDRGQPLRVSPMKLQVLFLGWLPQTGLLPPQHVDRVPEVLPAWVRYAARRTGLSQRSLDETLEALPAITEQFKSAYEDPERWNPQRKVVEQMMSDVDPTVEDVDDVFARRMFALPRLPDDGFDAGDDEAFDRLVAERYAADDPRLPVHRQVARQLWRGDPPEVWSTAQRLLDEGLERDDVLDALAYAAGAAGSDAGEYPKALAALPASWRAST